MKWTLVTGGAVRLGAQICRALAQSGRHIAIHYRSSKSQALQLCDELRSYPVAAEIIQGDFSQIESTKQFIEEYCARFEQTEALVNNVGNYAVAAASMTSAHMLRDLMQVNTIAPLMIIQGLLASLKQERGRIVNIGMVGVQYACASTHVMAYNMSKLSLNLLTKSLAKELAPDGVCVNMVSPGYIENSVDFPSLTNPIPAGRLAHCQEIAHAVRFFLSKEAAYITGQNLEVAGGVKL